MNFFLKNVDFAHENLIETFRTIIHLKIVNDNKFDSNVMFVAKIDKNFFHEFKFIIDSNANATIMIVFYDIEKNFERNQYFCDFFEIKSLNV